MWILAVTVYLSWPRIIFCNQGVPEIQPFNFPDNVSSGQKTSVSCSVIKGDLPLSFKWLKNGKEIPENSNIEVGQYKDVSILVINLVTSFDTGNYTCLAQNNLGSHSFTANLVVKAPPKWKHEPEDKSVYTGAKIEIMCQAEGYPIPKTLWFREKNADGKFDVLEPKPRYYITEWGNLTIVDVTPEDSGKYKCEVDNGVGEKLTAIVTLSVHGAPKIQPFVLPDLSIGNKASMSCSVIAGEAPLVFKWLKNTKDIVTSEDVNIRELQDVSILVIEPLTHASNGNYTCVVENKFGKDEYTVTLVVKAPPEWTEKPTDQEIFIGTTVQLKCKAIGYPEPQITWSRKIETTQEFDRVQSTSRYTVSESGELSMTDVREEDSGHYECKADNGVGQAIAIVIALAVHVPARFEEKFSIQTVRQGDSAILRCDAMGDHPIKVTWLRDKKELEISELSSRYEKFETSSTGGLNSELYIRTVDRRDGALYSCLAQNKYGSDDRNIKVLVVEVPARPLDVKIQEVWSRSASVRWTAPYAGNSPITKYVVQYWKDRAGSQRLQEEEIASGQTSMVINNLHPGSSYSLAVIAENEIGHGEPSETVRFVTGEEEPSGPPTDLWVEPRGPSTILVRWKAPPKEYWHGKLKGYYVGYRIEGSSQPYSFKTVEALNANITHEYLLSSLTKSTRYSIVVKAYNGAGTGPPSQELIVKTLDGILPRPPSVSLLSSSDSTISVKWGHTASRDEPVSGYTLHYRKGVGHWLHVPLLASDQTRYTLTGLDSDTTYNVYVTANNRFGRGDPSGILNVRTGDAGAGNRMPFYLDPSVVIPAAASLAAVIVVILVVSVFLYKSRTRRTIERAIHNGQQYAYAVNSSQRYIDMDKARPQSQPDPGTPAVSVASYASIPSRIDNEELYGDDYRQEILGPHNKQRPESFPRPSAIKKGIAHV